jgi:uncharacterized iron-regulated membrane protein
MSRDPRVKFINKWSRKLHRWGAILIALPLLVVICTGLLLQLKKEWVWIQPAERRGVGTTPSITFDQILTALRGVPEADVESWEDVDRLDVRPGKGMLKVRCNNDWEVQIDTATGEVLQVAYRRSDLIESIHDGSFFHASAKLWVFLPSGLVLLALWITGVYLWVLPIWAKRSGRKRRA